MKLTMQAKLAIRVAIIAVGLIGMFVAARGQSVSVADGGPILVCPPSRVGKTCTINLPPLVADGGPILVCPPSRVGKTCSINLPQVADGGPILVCPPSRVGKTCSINLPPVVADGGPILLCAPSDRHCSINLPLMS
jgi:hypothetical protein